MSYCKLFLCFNAMSSSQPVSQLAVDSPLPTDLLLSTHHYITLGTAAAADGDNMWAVSSGKDAGGLLQPLTEDNSWLEFQVKWKGWRSRSCPDGTTWVPQGNLCCDKLLARFVQDLRRRRIVPLPGQLLLPSPPPPPLPPYPPFVLA